MNALSNKLTITISSLLTLLFIVPVAQANVFTEDSQVYVGLKGGQLQTHADVGNLDINMDVDNAMAYGAYVGYGVNNGFGGELEYVKGSEADYNIDGLVFDGKVSTQSIGAYGVYRYDFANSSIYGKGKLGVSINSSDISASNGNRSDESKNSETDFAGGIGLGIKATENITIEAEYNRLSSEQALISIGSHLSF